MSMAEAAPNKPVAPVLRLHDELFYLIFQHLCAIYPAGADNKLGWIYVTHTCSPWRRIAIDECAPLWGRSLCVFPKAFLTFLARARDAKLTIKLMESDHRPEQLSWFESDELKEALLSVFRERPLQIQCASLVFPAFRAKLRNPTAPPVIDDPDPEIQAENARITAKGEQASLLSSATLSGLLGKMLPDLQQLEVVYDMIYCPVESTKLSNNNAFSAPGLISLKLLRQHIPVEMLYNILRNTPLLETLEVQWTALDGQTVLDDLPRLKIPLSLPRLKSISLGSPTIVLDSLRSLWSLIRPHADVRLCFIGPVSSGQEAIDFLAVLAPHLQRPSGDTLTVRWGGARNSGFALSSSSSTQSDPQPCVEIKFTERVPPAFILAVVDETFTAADYTRIRVLDLDVGLGFTLTAPHTVVQLAQFIALEELRVEFNPDGPLAGLDVLPTGIAMPLPIFPALKTLVLKRINLSGFSSWRAEGREVVSGFLRGRKEAGVPVSRVVLRGMKLDFSFDGVQDEVALRELGTDVDEVIDQRCDTSVGIMSIIADEDFL